MVGYNEWADLRADTKPNEPKFNVRYLCDPRKDRVVETSRGAVAGHPRGADSGPRHE